MRRALFSAALTFSFLMTPVALAQTAGSGASDGTSAQGLTPLPPNQQGRGVSGDSEIQPPGTYEPGDYSPVPQGDTGAEDNLGTPNTDYSGPGGSGVDPRYAPPSPASSFVPPGTGTSDTPGTGGSGDTNDTPASNQGSGSSAEPSTQQGTEPTDATGDARGGSAEAASSGKDLSPRQLTREVAMLRSDVLRLQRQVNALRGGNTGQQGAGTGGSGQADSGQSTPPAPSAPSPTKGANPEKTVVASVVMSGQVASTSKGRIVVRDSETGDLYNLRVGQNTQVVRDGQRISLDSLPQGTPVQAAYSLIADGSTDATRIQVAPSPRPNPRPSPRPR